MIILGYSNDNLKEYKLEGKDFMEYKIAVIPGDGIGPEIVEEAQKILNAIGRKYNHFIIRRYLWEESLLTKQEFL